MITIVGVKLGWLMLLWVIGHVIAFCLMLFVGAWIARKCGFWAIGGIALAIFGGTFAAFGVPGGHMAGLFVLIVVDVVVDGFPKAVESR